MFRKVLKRSKSNVAAALGVWCLAMMGVCVMQPANVQAQEQQQEAAQQKTTNQNTGSQGKSDVHQLRPRISTAELVKKSKIAIQDGLDFLVKTQNKDGSWGSHDPRIAMLKDYGFSGSDIGSHDGVRIACTAICAKAFLDTPNRTDDQQKTLERAIAELVKVQKFAFKPGTSFNTWGYGYKLALLVELAKAPEGKDLQDKIKAAAQSCVDGLQRYQQDTGGWSYYAGERNDAGNMSFNTGLFALSLSRAKKIGCKVPEGMVKDASAALERMRYPNGSFGYDSRFHAKISSAEARMGLGSASRTSAATYAMYELGLYSKKDLKISLDVFSLGENYLETARKKIQPHSGVHQNAGYYFFFGYNYASANAASLGDEVSQQRWDRFAWTMLRTQEEKGCWWDTPFGGYGEKWGTGFAVQTLHRFLRENTRRTSSETEPETKSDSVTKSRSTDDENLK